MRTMEMAFNAAGIWLRRPGIIVQAQREMEQAFRARRRERVMATIRGGWGHTLSREDLEYAVRELGARVSLDRRRVSHPGMPGWQQAGKRRRTH